MGNTDKIVRFDLTKNTYLIEEKKPYEEELIGGRGFGDWILFNEVGKDVSPLEPENIMIFGSGPLTGTIAPSSGRLSLVTKNLMSGGLAFSNAGGHFGPELRYAGFTDLVIQGKAAYPVYININDDQIEIRDASHLWGKDTWETEDLIKQELGDEQVQVLSIGPGGENLAKSACIIINKARALGFGGCGAIMGSKNLKAIAVRGSQPAQVSDPEGFMNECYRVFKKMEHSIGTNFLRQGGTINKIGPALSIPYRNYQDGHYGQKTAELSQLNFKRKYEIKRIACFNCPMNCSHFYSIEEGPYKGLKAEGLQINAVRGFGSNLDVADPAFVIKCNAYCNQLGLHIDEISSTLAWIFDCYEKNIVTKKDLDGLSLEWGNQAAAVELIRKIAYREGIGDILAEGTYRAALKIGRNSLNRAVTIKKTGVNEGNVRGKKAWALGIITSTRGGGHLCGSPNSEGLRNITYQIGKERYDVPTAGQPKTYEGKAKLVTWFEKFKAVVDSLGVCYFSSYWQNNLLSPDDYAALYSKVIGKDVDSKKLFEIGEKIINIEKAFNTIHGGFNRKDDYPPQRFMDEPVKTGPLAGERLPLDKWNKLLDEYYDFHGWDKETSWQTENILDKLQLTKIKEKLREEGRLIKK